MSPFNIQVPGHSLHFRPFSTLVLTVFFEGLNSKCETGGGNCTTPDEGFIIVKVFFSTLDVFEYEQQHAYGVRINKY